MYCIFIWSLEKLSVAHLLMHCEKATFSKYGMILCKEISKNACLLVSFFIYYQSNLSITYLTLNIAKSSDVVIQSRTKVQLQKEFLHFSTSSLYFLQQRWFFFLKKNFSWLCKSERLLLKPMMKKVCQADTIINHILEIHSHIVVAWSEHLIDSPSICKSNLSIITVFYLPTLPNSIGAKLSFCILFSQ